MFLENEIIKLRPVEPEDAETMWIVESDSEQWMQNGMSAPLSRQNLTDYALSYDADPVRAGQLRLIIESKPEKGIIGIADLYDISVQHRHAFVGIYIFPHVRRSGLALASLDLLERYAFNLLNIRHLVAKVMEDNAASSNLFEKAGYVYRGELPEWYQTGNEFRPLKILSKIIAG